MRFLCSNTALLLMFAAGCSDRAPEPVARAVPNGNPVGCIIRGEPTCELGKAPKIAVALTNQTDADIYLVGSLDASDCRWRYPHCYFEVIGPDGKPVERGLGRCGNMNTLRVKDFVMLPPGESFDPYRRVDDGGFFSAHQLEAHTFGVAGAYRIRFVYSTKGDDIGEWSGDGKRSVASNAEIVELFKQVPKIEVRSDEFMLTVIAAGK